MVNMNSGMTRLAVGLAAMVGTVTAWSSDLPVVDLGYQMQRASNFNATINAYNFSNVRYAQNPVGNLRFAAPAAPLNDTSGTIYDGNDGAGRICLQGTPGWSQLSAKFIEEYLLGLPVNASSFPPINMTVPAADPRETEDCLFLDVYVPKAIFDAAKNGSNTTAGAPVMVWVFGGGYVEGSKYELDPTGLISRSNEEVIFVGINYRLGALGFSSGPTFQENGTSNAGFHDQRFALEWVQNNIGKFGGDKDRVTVFGESAGGGSIMHQITAYGGLKGPAPFAQAIMQSPGWNPNVSPLIQEQAYTNFLSVLNASDISAARAASTDAIRVANYAQILTSPYGQFIYGPTVDGDFVPALPGVLLSHGQFDSSVKIYTAHNADEGLLFTSPNATMMDYFSTLIPFDFPEAETSVQKQIESMYPLSEFKDDVQRVATVISEFAFVCNVYYLSKAFDGANYGYNFDVFPALHGFDIPYTFYPGPANKTSFGKGLNFMNVTVATTLQTFLTSFAIDGKPSDPAIIGTYDTWGSTGNVVALNNSAIYETTDTQALSKRCEFWQKGLYY